MNVLYVYRNQLVHSILKNERPEIEAKRIDLLKLQGEYQVTLKNLEQELLDSLNKSEGNILEDDSLIKKLEILKFEVDTITQKSSETSSFIIEVEDVTTVYQCISESFSNVFFILEDFSKINHFYQYSLSQFMTLFQSILESPSLESNYAQRLLSLETRFYQTVVQRFTSNLKSKDQAILNILLCCTKFESEELNEMMLLFENKQSEYKSEEIKLAFGSEVERHIGILLESSSSSFSKFDQIMLSDKLNWQKCIDSSNPECCIPKNDTPSSNYRIINQD